jgi:hypothetical protein
LLARKVNKPMLHLVREKQPFSQANIFLFNLFIFYNTLLLTSDCCSFLVDCYVCLNVCIFLTITSKVMGAGVIVIVVVIRRVKIKKNRSRYLERSGAN